MKNMSNRKILTIGLIVIAVCLLISGVYVFTNRTAKRTPTEQEIALCEPYGISWQEATGQTGSDKQIILGLCTYSEKQTIGSNEYEIYTSEKLSGYLYKFEEMVHIGVLNDCLYVQYKDTDGHEITLAYSDAGMMEKAVYFPETDTLYYEQGKITEVWEKFRTGVPIGA